MVRMQVQIPDDLYERLKRVADAKEWSLAETIRRAAEVLVGTYPRATEVKKPRRMPDPVDLGKPLVPQESWSEVLMRDRLNHSMGIEDGKL